MGEWCHMEPCQIHTGVSKPQHPGGETKYHPTDRICQVHPGHVSVGRCGRLCGCGPCVRPRYSCCGKKETTEGCRQVLSCCRQPAESTGCQARYRCCGVNVETCSMKGCTNIYSCCSRDQDSEGCSTVCRKCGELWGTNSRNCYNKPHNTVVKYVHE